MLKRTMISWLMRLSFLVRTKVLPNRNYLIRLNLKLNWPRLSESASKAFQFSLLSHFFPYFQIATSEGERRNLSALYNPFTIRQLQATYPYLNWLNCINGLLPEGVQLDEDEMVIVDVPNYFLQLGSILQATPKRTIANYFAWRSVFFSSDLLNSALHTRKLQFLATTIGLRKLDPRYNTCVTLTSQ